MSEMPQGERPGRRRAVIGAAVAIAVVLVVVLALLLQQRGVDDAAAPSSSSSPSATDGPTPAPSATAPGAGPTEPAPATGASPAPDGPDVPLTVEPVPEITVPPLTSAPPRTVPLDAPADVAPSVAARVVAVESVEASGTGIGEVGGPALLVTLELGNASAEPLDLGGVTVNGYLGPEAVPASPVTSDERSAPFSGALAPGASTRGRYVFSLGGDDTRVLSVAVLAALDGEVVVFQGAVTPSGG